MKKNERRAIIEHLGPELGKMEFEAQTLRGRTLDEAKLNRWMKLEKLTFEETLVENNEVACVPGRFNSSRIQCILLIFIIKQALYRLNRIFHRRTKTQKNERPHKLQTMKCKASLIYKFKNRKTSQFFVTMIIHSTGTLWMSSDRPVSPS